MFSLDKFIVDSNLSLHKYLCVGHRGEQGQTDQADRGQIRHGHRRSRLHRPKGSESRVSRVSTILISLSLC